MSYPRMKIFQRRTDFGKLFRVSMLQYRHSLSNASALHIPAAARLPIPQSLSPDPFPGRGTFSLQKRRKAHPSGRLPAVLLFFGLCAAGFTAPLLPSTGPSRRHSASHRYPALCGTFRRTSGGSDGAARRPAPLMHRRCAMPFPLCRPAQTPARRRSRWERSTLHCHS